MCGFIAGSNLNFDLNELIEQISYRGLPGYKGYGNYDNIQFAHYSLPFVNLNPDTAIQPRFTNQGEPGLFVGEIFNYKNFLHDNIEDLNDAEVINNIYHSLGSDSFHLFDGFWSYVTIKDKKIIAFTDYLAQKPIYYRTDIEILSNEIEVLRTVKPCTRNELFHSNVLKWGYDPTGGTPWNEIKQVPPGHYYYDGQVYNYWDWNKVPCDGTLYQLLEKATLNRLGGQREVSILLSGGLDSSIIYGLIKKSGKNVTAIHVDNGEKDYVKLLLDETIDVTLDDVSDEEALTVHQSPVDLGSVKPQIAMGKKLKELGFYAVMTGDGADELFGGYRRAKEYDSQYSDIFCELPYYHLPKIDRTMMRYTIETRSPFLSAPVVAYALKVPYEQRNGEKKVLKEEFKDIVPKEILYRDKLPLKTESIRKDPMKQRIDNEKLWRKIYGQ